MAKAKKSKGSKKKELVEETPKTVLAPSPKFILLEGRVPRTLSFQLDHAYFCEELGECRCGTMKVGVVKQSKVDGSESPVFKQRRVAASIDVRYKKKTQVEEAALKVPAIAAAINSRKIRVHR